MKTVADSYDVLPRWVLPTAFRPFDLTGSVFALLAATNGPVPVRVVSEVHALHSRDRVGAAGGLPPVGRPARPAPLRQAGPALHALPVLLHPGAVHLHRLAQHRSTGPHPETAGRRRARPLTQNLSPPQPSWPSWPGGLSACLCVQGAQLVTLKGRRRTAHGRSGQLMTGLLSSRLPLFLLDRQEKRRWLATVRCAQAPGPSRAAVLGVAPSLSSLTMMSQPARALSR